MKLITCWMRGVAARFGVRNGDEAERGDMLGSLSSPTSATATLNLRCGRGRGRGAQPRACPSARPTRTSSARGAACRSRRAWAVSRPLRQPASTASSSGRIACWAGAGRSPSGGSSASAPRPKWSRKRAVTPQSSGWPGASSRPTGSIRSRERSVRSDPPAPTPRTRSNRRAGHGLVVGDHGQRLERGFGEPIGRLETEQRFDPRRGLGGADQRDRRPVTAQPDAARFVRRDLGEGLLDGVGRDAGDAGEHLDRRRLLGDEQQAFEHHRQVLGPRRRLIAVARCFALGACVRGYRRRAWPPSSQL